MMPPLVQGFLAVRPSVEIHIRECRDGDAILEDIRSGVADFGVGLIAAAGEPFGCQFLFREHLWEAVGPAGRRLGSGPLIHGQLLTEGEVLEDQRSMSAHEEGEHVDGADEPGDHGSG